MKRAEWINTNYLVKHAENIINNTRVLFPEWLVRKTRSYDDGDYLQNIWERMYQKHQRETGNWYAFGRGDKWILPGETWEEAEDCIVREYCEATGHWDLFIWKEIEEV